MVFSSTIFTFLFLPIVLGLYYLAKQPYRNYILLAASILFYGYGEPRFVYVMLASVLANYLFALAIDRVRPTPVRIVNKESTASETEVSGQKTAKILLILAIAVNLGLLFVFKYLDFSICIIDRMFHAVLSPVGIALPIGISFFTFQAMSYVIDVYRGTAKVQKNPLYVALYISFSRS